MNKKRLAVLFIIVLFSCSFVSMLFHNRNIKRNIEFDKKEQEEKERYEKTLKDDLIAPILILKQDKIVIYQGDEISYKSFIKEASDNLEGNLISKVKYVPIDNNAIGEFYVNYEVCDAASNVAATRMLVIIREKPNFKY